MEWEGRHGERHKCERRLGEKLFCRINVESVAPLINETIDDSCYFWSDIFTQEQNSSYE